jgi:hypothetical protein
MVGGFAAHGKRSTVHLRAGLFAGCQGRDALVMRKRNTTRRIEREARARKRSPAGKPSRGSRSDTRGRALQVKGDMRRNPTLTFTQASHNRRIDPRSVRKHIASAFRKDSSGRVKARPSDRFRATLYIPSAKPGVQIPVPTRGSRERKLLGRWMDAINAAGRGDFSKMKEFTRGHVVGGVRLSTGDYEVQQILRALAEEESPFEGLYRSLARPS